MLNIVRYKNNPVIAPDSSIAWMSRRTMNPGVWYDGKIFHMVFTASGDAFMDKALCLGYAWSKNGKDFTIRKEPFIIPSENEMDFDHGTIDDARITKIDDIYYITYAARSFNNILFRNGMRRKNNPNDNPTWTENFRRVGLATTRDFKSYNKMGPLTSELFSDANVIFFPEKIKGRYAVLHRPSPFIPNTQQIARNTDFVFQIRLAYTDDLINWYDDTVVAEPEYEWENQKIGGAGVPIKTDEGWLTIYHGVYYGPDVHIRTYRVGVMLLDLENPSKIIARSPDFIMEPEKEYEQFGNHNNVVFPCANPVVDGIIHIYYGAADTSCCLATVSLRDLLDFVIQYRK